MGGSFKKLVSPFKKTLFPGLDKATRSVKKYVTHQLPKAPAAPVAPTDNAPDLAAAAEAERQAEAKRLGRASTVLAGELDEEANKAKRTLLGG